jgi:hypothetical protein
MRFHSFEDIMEGLGAEDEEAMEEVDVATILATMTAAELIDREDLINVIHESFFLSFDPNSRQIVSTGTIRNYLVPLRRFYIGLGVPIGVVLGPEHLTDENMARFVDSEGARLDLSGAFRLVSAAFNWILTMIALPRLHGTPGAYPLTVLAIRSWIFRHKMQGIVPKGADGFSSDAVKYIMDLPIECDDNQELLYRTVFVLQVYIFTFIGCKLS